MLIDQGEYTDAAAVSEDLWRDAAGEDLADVLKHVSSFLAECAVLAANDEKLASEERQATALPYAKRALEAFEQAAKIQTTTAPVINLAWFRLACPVVALRDVREAFRLAQEVAAKAPARADSWSILGAALYYNGDQKAALDAFGKSRELDPGKFGVWEFCAAMAHLKLGERAEAQAMLRPRGELDQTESALEDARAGSGGGGEIAPSERDPATPSRTSQDLHAPVH